MSYDYSDEIADCEKAIEVNKKFDWFNYKSQLNAGDIFYFYEIYGYRHENKALKVLHVSRITPATIFTNLGKFKISDGKSIGVNSYIRLPSPATEEQIKEVKLYFLQNKLKSFVENNLRKIPQDKIENFFKAECLGNHSVQIEPPYRVLFSPDISAYNDFSVECQTQQEAEKIEETIANYTLFLQESGLMDDLSNYGLVQKKDNDGDWVEVED